MTFCISDHLKKRVIHIWPHRDKSSYVYYLFVQRFQIRWCFCCLLVKGRVSLVEYIGGVMVSVIASNVVDWDRLIQLGLCCFSVKHAALRRKRTWSSISLKINLFSPWYSWNIDEMAVNNNQSVLAILEHWVHFQV
jgi:hypothetical protein